MPHTLVNLTPDVLLYISQYCELADLFSLSATCVLFWTLSKQKIYWLVPLITTRIRDPIACPLRDDLRTRSVERLKDIARQTLRLRENWSSPQPRICGGVKKRNVGKAMDFILQVPGTTYYILHCRRTGDLIAFDPNDEIPREPPLRVHISERIADVSPGLNEEGVFSMGLLANTSAFGYMLVIVSLTYNDQGITELKLSRETELPRRSFYWGVFISSDIIGVLQVPIVAGSVGQTLNVLVYNINRTQVATIITTDIDAQDFMHNGHSGTWVANNDLYFLTEGNTSRQTTVYRFPRDILPSDNNAKCEKKSSFQALNNIHTTWTAPDATFVYSTEGALTADTYYRVPCVSLYSSDDGHNPTMQVRFWSMPNEVSEEKNSFHMMSPAIAHVTGSLPRENGPWQLSLIPHSGRYMLLVVEHIDEENNDLRTYKLMLVGYDTQTRSCTVHDLQTPEGFDLSATSGLCLDDHSGNVSLMTMDGYLHVINYA